MTNLEYKNLKNLITKTWDAKIKEAEKTITTEEVYLLKTQKLQAQELLLDYYQNIIELKHDEWLQVLKGRLYNLEQEYRAVEEEIKAFELEERQEEEIVDVLELRLPDKTYLEAPSTILAELLPGIEEAIKEELTYQVQEQKEYDLDPNDEKTIKQ